MRNLIKLSLITLTLLVVFFSCSKISQEMEDENASRKRTRIKSGNVTNIEDAEGSTIFSNITKQTYTSYGITQSDSQYHEGSKSVRFELRDTDSMNNSGTRAEVAFPATTILNKWYGFSMYMPSNYWQYDNADDVVMQWHQGGGATPALCLRIKKDTAYLRFMGNQWLNLGYRWSLSKDIWHRYGIHIKFSSDTSTNPLNSSTGLVEVVCDGYWIFRHYGPNMYTVGGTYSNPIWKFGIYKSGWNNNGTTMTSRRVLYFDKIQTGDSTCTEDDFMWY